MTCHVHSQLYGTKIDTFANCINITNVKHVMVCELPLTETTVRGTEFLFKEAMQERSRNLQGDLLVTCMLGSYKITHSRLIKSATGLLCHFPPFFGAAACTLLS